MFGRMRRVRRNWLVPACVAVLLLTVLAGVLQYRGINRWSNAVRRQRREVMERTLRNLSGDFRDTLLQLMPFFRPPPDERNDAAFEPYMIESARRWHSTSDRPQLLASISIGTQSDKGVVFRRLQAGDNQFKTEDWPDEFVAYRRILRSVRVCPTSNLRFSRMDRGPKAGSPLGVVHQRLRFFKAGRC